MPINWQQLLQILPNACTAAGVFVLLLDTAMGRYQLVIRLRIGAFLAPVGHKSAYAGSIPTSASTLKAPQINVCGVFSCARRKQRMPDESI
ncbi:hypothetical protein J3P77_11880 [Pseudomonas sp. R1-18]